MIYRFIYFPLIHRALYCFPQNTPRSSTVTLNQQLKHWSQLHKTRLWTPTGTRVTFLILSKLISACRRCGEHPETVSHIISGCPKLAQTVYLERHNSVASTVHWSLINNNNNEIFNNNNNFNNNNIHSI